MSFKTCIGKIITTAACATLMFAGTLGLNSISAKAATTKNVTIDFSKGRTITFNSGNVDENSPSKDYVDSFATFMVMCCYDSNVRNTMNSNSSSFTSVLSTNPYQGIYLGTTTDHTVSMNALKGSVGTGKYVLNKDILMKYPETFDFDQEYIEDQAKAFMTSLDAMYSGDVRAYYEKHFINNQFQFDDIEYIVEIKYSDAPVTTNYTVNAAPTVTYAVGSEFEDNGIKYRVIDAAGNVSAISLTSKSKNVTIPDSVNFSGCTLNVTEISQNFMKGNKKTKKVTIGANVTSIGKEAFYKCKKLKKVTIKSTNIISFGKKAFGKNANDFTLKMPKSCKKAYKKLLKKAKIKI